MPGHDGTDVLRIGDTAECRALLGPGESGNNARLSTQGSFVSQAARKSVEGSIVGRERGHVGARGVNVRSSRALGSEMTKLGRQSVDDDAIVRELWVEAHDLAP